MFLQLDWLDLDVTLALDYFYGTITKDLLYLSIKFTNNHRSMLFLSVFIVPNQCAFALFDNCPINIFSIGTHNIGDAIEPHFVGE